MNLREMKTWLILTAAAACAAPAGCGRGERPRTVAGSGDPEADQRAEMRVGHDDRGGSKPTGEQGTLFKRLGGTAGIQAIVDDMTARSINDPRVNFSRSSVKSSWLGKKYPEWDASPQNVDRFKQHMVEFITLASGGPAEYTGREMRAVHAGMKITNNEFDAMVGDIKTSMDKLAIPAREKRDLLAIVETTRKQIVEE